MIKVVIEVTSKADLPLSDSIVETLERLGIQSVLRVDSARKTKAMKLRSTRHR